MSRFVPVLLSAFVGFSIDRYTELFSQLSGWQATAVVVAASIGVTSLVTYYGPELFRTLRRWWVRKSDRNTIATAYERILLIHTPDVLRSGDWNQAAMQRYAENASLNATYVLDSMGIEHPAALDVSTRSSVEEWHRCIREAAKLLRVTLPTSDETWTYSA